MSNLFCFILLCFISICLISICIMSSYVKKITRIVVNLVIFSLCTLLSLGLSSCNSSYSLHNFVDDVRPSTYFKSVDIHLSGDTLSYYRLMLPRKYYANE